MNDILKYIIVIDVALTFLLYQYFMHKAMSHLKDEYKNKELLIFLGFDGNQKYYTDIGRGYTKKAFVFGLAGFSIFIFLAIVLTTL